MLPLSFVGAPLEMTKRRWKDIMQTLCENHFDPKKVEELKESKLELENKLVPKIVKLVKERRQNRRNRNTEAILRKESELIELIEDFHKRYQFVYDQYDDLKGQLSQTANGAKEDEGYFTATSSSDSETESSEKNVINTGDKKVQMNEDGMQELKNELDEKKTEISSLVQKHKSFQLEISSLMKELESEFSSFNVKLDAMCAEKKTSEKRVVENKQVQDNISRLEKIVKEMNEEDGFVFEVSKINGLMIQANHLKLNVDCLNNNAQKTDTGDEHKARQSNNNSSDAMQENLPDQVNRMKRELGSLRKKNTDLESNVKKKSRENSEFLSRIDDLKKEVASTIEEVQKMQKEKEDSLVRVKKLELEVQNICSQRSEKEKIIADKEEENLQLTQEIEALNKEISELHRQKDMKSNIDEHEELGDEKESLEAKILEQEITLTEKEDLVADLQSAIQVGENEKNYLHRELLVERKNFSERLNQLENQNNELSFKLSDQQFTLKQQEETINKLRADCKLMKGRFLQAAERKMDEVAEEFRKHFEDKLRILGQRVRVSEQLHYENKENWKNMKEQCEQKHPGLRKRLAQVMTVSGESDLRVVFGAVDEMMKEMECLVSKLERTECGFVERLSRVSNDIKLAKNWAHCMMNEKINEPQSSGNAGRETTTEDDKKQDHKVGMKEKVSRRSEANKVNNKDKGDKLRLMRGMYEMQKKVAELEKVVVEKDAGLLRLRNEKVEAIRQLCVWVDYRQSRFDHQLKEVMLLKKRS